MEGLHELIPCKRPLRLAGRTWMLNIRRVADWAEIEAFLFARRRPGPTPPQDENRSDVAERISIDEVAAWLDTKEGMSFCLWQSMRDSEPRPTRETVEKWLAAADPRTFAVVRGELAQTDGLPETRPGKLPGRSPRGFATAVRPARSGVKSFAA